LASPQTHRRAAERITIVRSLDDFSRVTALRAICYVSGQDCPFDEEFDGNDLCAMHLLGWIGGEPAACLRMRFFGDFAKLERLAVRPDRRRSTLAFRIVREALRIAARKGFRRAYGHAQVGLEPFWRRFGARPISAEGAFAFSGRRYTEMMLETGHDPAAIGLGSNPMVIIRPEGAWDAPGVLERDGRSTGASDAFTRGRDAAGGWTQDAEAAWKRTYRPAGFEDDSEAGWTDDRDDWSGRRDSNPRPQPWQGCALPLSYSRFLDVAGSAPKRRLSIGRRLYAKARRAWQPLISRAAEPGSSPLLRASRASERPSPEKRRGRR